MSAPARARALLLLGIALVYAAVRDFPFVVLDDPAFVGENPLVNAGLGIEAILRAFAGAQQGNWVPLTWISHMLDVELFGLDAGAHHVVNVLLHAVATLLLFEVLQRATGAVLPSTFVAAVFALHPMHVESVAWIAERRDPLSAVFWMLSLLAWVSFARAPAEGRRARYVAAVACFALGLMAKPMVVTLPLVLLLLDFWPLGRAERGVRRLLLEKLPFVAVALAAAVMTLVTQAGAGAVASLAMLPFELRLANAAVSTVTYVWKTAVPLNLAVFYPYPEGIPLARSLPAAAALLLATALAIGNARRRPWLTVGWLWFVVTLLPVIGLVQVGSQGMADRYTYLPMVGLALAAAFGVAELAAAGASARAAWIGIASAWLLTCGVLAHAQVGTWRSSVALFDHARSVTGDNPIAHVSLGEAYEEIGQDERAIAHYRAALPDYPHAPRVRTRLGILLERTGRSDEAERQLHEALRRHPDEPDTRAALGRLYLHRNELARARQLLEAELEHFPDSATAAELAAELEQRTSPSR